MALATLFVGLPVPPPTLAVPLPMVGEIVTVDAPKMEGVAALELLAVEVGEEEGVPAMTWGEGEEEGLPPPNPPSVSPGLLTV